MNPLLAQEPVESFAEIYRVSYETTTVIEDDPIEEKDELDNVVATLSCISGDVVGELFLSIELWQLDFDAETITISYADDGFNESLNGEFDPILKTFQISIIGDFEPVEGNESFRSKEDVTVSGSFGSDGFDSVTGTFVETRTTGWDRDGRTVTCSSTFSFSASRDKPGENVEEIYRVSYETTTVIEDDPIEEKNELDEVVATLSCISGDLVGELFLSIELWQLDFDAETITISYADDGFNESLSGEFDPILKTFQISIIGDFEPVEGNESFRSKEDVTISGNFGPDGFDSVTGTFVETRTTGWDRDGRTVSCSSTFSFSGSRENTPFEVRWPDGDPIANTVFQFKGVFKETNESGILDPAGIPLLRDSVFPNDFIRLEKDGENILIPIGKVDLLRAKQDGFFVIDVFEIGMRWPNGDPVQNAGYFVNGELRFSGNDGVLDLSKIPLSRSDSNPRDEIDLARNSGTLYIPFGPIDIVSVVDEGTYTLDLCEWANETTQLFVDYKEDYEFAKSIENEMRKPIELDYEVVQRQDGWFVRPDTALKKTIDALGDLITAFDPRPWVRRMRELFCDFAIGGTPGNICEFLGEGKFRFILEKDLRFVTFELTRLFLEDTTQVYPSEAAARKALNDFRTHMFGKWKEFEPIYNQLREEQPELVSLWDKVVENIIFIRGKSDDPEACVPKSDYDVLAFPPSLLPPLVVPDIEAINNPRADDTLFLFPGIPVILPPSSSDGGSITSFPANHSETGVTFVWTKVGSDGVNVVGEEETYSIESFTADDAGEYRRATVNVDGEVINVESYGLYVRNEIISPPTFDSSNQVLVTFTGSSFVYTPEISSLGVTAFSWLKGDQVFKALTDPSFSLFSASEEDEGIYSINVENPGGEIEAEVFELRVIDPPLESLNFESVELVLSIQTESGIAYTVEQSADLNQWFPLGDSVSGDGTVRNASINGYSPGSAYLRIRVEGE